LLSDQSVLNSYDVIVIGSGISGLTIALIMAKEGKKVALFERDRDIAPLIRPYRRKGCEFSPGLHIVGWMDQGEVIASFLNYLQIDDGVETKLYHNGFGNVIIGAQKYMIPRGFDSFEAKLHSYFPECHQAVKEYIKAVKEINERSFLLNHQLDIAKDTDLQFNVLEKFSLKEFLECHQASAEMIEMLGTFNNVLIGSTAEEVPFDTHAFVLGGYYQSSGAFTINGINRLLLNFKRELTNYGVDLFLNSEVAEILVDNERKVTGVKIANGNSYLAPLIITSFNPKLLMEKLAPNVLRPIFKRRLIEADNTFGLYTAFYKIDSDEELEIGNLAYYNSNTNVTLGATINKYDNDNIISVFIAENELEIPNDIEERRWRAGQRLSLLEQTIYDVFPFLRGKLVLLDYLKPWSFERFTKTVNGSAYGIKQTTKSVGFQNRVPVRGLYLVGQAIFPGFLGSLVSSFKMALELLAPDDFWLKVKRR